VEPTEWVRDKMQKDEGVFAEILQGVDVDIDVSEMEPEEFDALDDGLDTNEHHMESIPMGKKRKHALAAVARYEDIITEYELRSRVREIYTDIETDTTYATYVADVLNQIYEDSESTHENFIEKVEAEIRDRRDFGSKESDKAIQSILSRDRPEKNYGIISETVELLHALNRLYEDYKFGYNKGVSERIEELRNDITIHAIDHFQESDDVKNNLLFQRIDEEWFNIRCSQYNSILNHGEESIEELLVELEQGQEDKSKQAEKEAEDTMEKYNKSEFV
jgi:uncharacterized protein YqgV (UPF0045/DUF77 family)